MKTNGVQHCLWRAVDHEGEVLESYVTKIRDEQATPSLAFMLTRIFLSGRMLEICHYGTSAESRKMSNQTQDAGEQHRPYSRFLSLSQVTNLLSISKSTVYAQIHNETLPFPKPVHIGRRSVWIEKEIKDYMDAVVSESRHRNPQQRS